MKCIDVLWKNWLKQHPCFDSWLFGPRVHSQQRLLFHNRCGPPLKSLEASDLELQNYMYKWLIPEIFFSFHLSISPQVSRPLLARLIVLGFFLSLVLSLTSALPGWRYEKRRIRGSIFGKRNLDASQAASLNQRAFDAPNDAPRDDLTIQQARSNLMALLRELPSRRWTNWPIPLKTCIPLFFLTQVTFQSVDEPQFGCAGRNVTQSQFVYQTFTSDWGGVGSQGTKDSCMRTW